MAILLAAAPRLRSPARDWYIDGAFFDNVAEKVSGSGQRGFVAS
jgi:hypothetical protein